MSVHYKISPELGIAFMFCNGLVSDIEYFRAVRNMYDDKSYKLGMRRIVDFFSATEDVSLEGMRSVIKYREEMEGKGITFEHVILLTHSKTIFLFVNAMKMLTTKAKMKFDAVESLDEAISLLEYQDRKQEVFDFYNQNKYLVKQEN